LSTTKGFTPPHPREDIDRGADHAG
jgi:hypothetical protein